MIACLEILNAMRVRVWKKMMSMHRPTSGTEQTQTLSNISSHHFLPESLSVQSLLPRLHTAVRCVCHPASMLVLTT